MDRIGSMLDLYEMSPGVQAFYKDQYGAAGLTQAEFVHRALTTPSGNLRKGITVRAYLSAMVAAKLNKCDDFTGVLGRRELRLPKATSLEGRMDDWFGTKRGSK